MSGMQTEGDYGVRSSADVSSQEAVTMAAGASQVGAQLGYHSLGVCYEIGSKSLVGSPPPRV